MQFVRSLVTKTKVLSTDGSSDPEDQQNALQTLRKHFHEFEVHYSNQNQNDVLYNITAIFCNIFGNASPTEMVSKFPEIHNFCTHCARLLVKEVKAKAVNKSTEEASIQIARYLSPQLQVQSTSRFLSSSSSGSSRQPPRYEINQSSDNKGWYLLTSLNILCSGPLSLVECISSASLPSTLVKCLYIFFDLPPIGGEDSASSNTSREKVKILNKQREMLLTSFRQLLQRLCMYSVASEELAKRDDLSLLFSAVASVCPPHNVMWRKVSADILSTIAQNSLTGSVIQHITIKHCIAQCLQNVNKGGFQPIEIVDMFVTMFNFLRESSSLSQTLLDDFRSCQGYVIIQEFLINLEKEDSNEAKDALRNIVCLVGRLTTCGFLELRPKPSSGEQLFTIGDFEMPQPRGTLESVRNIQAFHVLQSVFLKAQTAHLCEIILEVIKSIYCQDPANYFILEPQNTLASFAEKVHLKPLSVQASFFDVLESIVFLLKFVPTKEISSLTLLIKSCRSSPKSLLLCMKSLLKLCTEFSVFKDVYRELGVLDLIVSQLHQYADLVRQQYVANCEPTVPTAPPKSSPAGQEVRQINKEELQFTAEEQRSMIELGLLIMELLSTLLTNSQPNASLFRSGGGARCVLNMVPYLEANRDQALSLIQQLVLTTGGEDDMATLLGLMHTSSNPNSVKLKVDVLNSLCTILRDSHRCRAVFRKVNGFVYVMQELVHMEGCLRDPPKPPWDLQERSQVLLLLKTIFSTISVAMKYEPANAKHFTAEVRYASLTEAVRFLGCFGNDVDLLASQEPFPSNQESKKLSSSSDSTNKINPFEQYFMVLREDCLDPSIPKCLLSACFMTRCLYDMALDAFDKPITKRTRLTDLRNSSGASQTSQSGTVAPPAAMATKSRAGQLVMSTGLLGSYEGGIEDIPGSPVVQSTHQSVGSDPADLMIVHSGAVLCILHLLPAILCESAPNYQLDLQICLLNVLKSLLRGERNQQVMCEVGMPHDILTHFRVAMTDESHPLHQPVQHLFERLAAQSLTPKDLREFLRLSNPLCCSPLLFPPELQTNPPHSAQTIHGPSVSAVFSSEPSSAATTSNSDGSHFPLPPHLQHLNHQEQSQLHQSQITTNKHGGPVSISRVRSLVSMTTPRDSRMAPNPTQSVSRECSGSLHVSFVEFNMSLEGFGCLFLPSISPHGSQPSTMVSVGLVTSLDNNTTGGIGIGERLFPSTNGFSFSTWICVDRFSSSSVAKSHPIRLLTIVRGVSGSNEQVICLSVALMPSDRSLLVSTKERLLGQEKPGGDLAESTKKGSVDTTTRFCSPELSVEGRWRHVVLVFHRSGMMKHSSCSLFIDGQLFATQKLSYICPNVTASSASQTSQITSVSAYVGTPPLLRRISSTIWRQGPFHMVEEPLSHSAVTVIHQLGPSYMGSFQAPVLESDSTAQPLFPEEKLTLGIFGVAMSTMTVSRIRKVYNQADAKAIAKQLHISIKENATPIHLLHNSAAHLTGPARSIGAVLVGYQGVRVFTPHPVVRVLECVGGTAVLLGLVAMVNDAQGMYAAVKALSCVVRNSASALKEMIRTRGFQMLAMLFKKKCHLLNSHILSLTYSLAGCCDDERSPGPSTIIQNRAAFEDLVCDLEIWRETQGDLLKLVLDHLIELAGDRFSVQREMESSLGSSVQSVVTGAGSKLSSVAASGSAAAVAVMTGVLSGQGISNSSGSNSSAPQSNIEIILELGMVGKIINLLLDPQLPSECLEPASNLLKLLLFNVPRSEDLRKFAQFLVWTLPQLGTIERNVLVTRDLTSCNAQTLTSQSSFESDIGDSSSHVNMQRLITIRNSCLEIFIHNMTYPLPYNQRVCDEFQKVVGFDWLMLFMQESIHDSSIVLALRALLILLSNPQALVKFREGFSSGGWLQGTEQVLKRRRGLLLVHDNTTADKRDATTLREINSEACRMPGFSVLVALLPLHCRIPEVHFLLTALLLGKKVKQIPTDTKLELDSLYNFIFGDSTTNGNASESQTSQQTPNKSSKKVRTAELCPEAAYILLAMIRSMLNQGANLNEDDDWLQNYPITLLRFLLYLYQSNMDFQPIAMTPEFLMRLAAPLFPVDLNLLHGLPMIPPIQKQIEESQSNDSLIQHPARQSILSFLKMIITDSFSLNAVHRPHHVVDILLEGGPEHSTTQQQKDFQTILINTLIEHLLAAEILSGSNLPLPPGGSYAAVHGNVFYFVTRSVDKLWQEMYLGDSKELVVFINLLLAQGRQRQLSMEPLYRALYRLVLHQLSRSLYSHEEQVLLLNILNEMTSLDHSSITQTPTHVVHCRSVLFSQAASSSGCDADLLPCLVFLLCRLVTQEADMDDMVAKDNFRKIAQACRKLWEELYINKKRALEEFLRVPINPSGSLQYPSLLSVLEVIEEPCLRAWTNFMQNECYGSSTAVIQGAVWNRCGSSVSSYPGLTTSGSATSHHETSKKSDSTAISSSSSGHHRLHQQLSIKLNRMSSGVLRLAAGATDRASAGLASAASNVVAASGGEVRHGSERRHKRTDPSSQSVTSTIMEGKEGVMPYHEAKLWVPPHVSVVKELLEFYLKQHTRNDLFMRRYLESEWETIESELTRERGLWGPPVGNPLDKWTLDTTEGPCRMRKKMIKNCRFYEHYPYRGESLQTNKGEVKTFDRTLRYRVAQSKDSGLYFTFYRTTSVLPSESCSIQPRLTIPSTNNDPHSPACDPEESDVFTADDPDPENAEETLRHTETLLRRSSIILAAQPSLSDSIGKRHSSSINEESGQLVEGDDMSEEAEPTELSASGSSNKTIATAGQSDHFTEGERDSQAAILRLLEPGEKISSMFRCARIQGLDVYEGLLLFGRDHFYVIDGFTLIRTYDLVDIDSLPADSYEPIVPVTSSTINMSSAGRNKKEYFKFPYEGIREVQKRRYLLQPIALEVFNTDGRNFLLVFPKRMQNKIHSKFSQMSTALSDSAQQSVSGQKQNAKVESGSVSILNNLIGEKSVTQRWERGEISNFQYLMYLNTLAGRSYNDLMQYPIFPWVLADYESDHLDLTLRETFRDLSKPMGALNPDRLEQFQRRYIEWDDPSGETPPYYYGTHYSSAMIVASYLIRMEPFTQHFLKLQGGHFDLADRMFHSIRDAWNSASALNMADVKELIPEFYYLPDFLVNSNNFDLGVKQSGIELGDVILPPWAKGDPREFIRAHREALESDFVSAHLHEWIDLIFGYKQRGETSVEAHNVFHHLFYEGNVDIYSIDDPLKQSAVIGFINNFGQIPQLLFRKPHPSKKLAPPPRNLERVTNISSTSEKLFFHNLDVLKPSTQPVKELKSYVGHIVQLENKVISVEQNKCFIPPAYTRYLAWGFADGSLRIGHIDSERAVRVFEMADSGEILCAVAPSEKTIITGGISTAVRVWQIGLSRMNRSFILKAALYGHTEAVTCLSASANWNLLVSGSRDRTCILWDLSRLLFLRQLSNHAAPVACVSINEATGDIATCAGTYLHLWSINGEEIASVNTASGRSKQILTVAMSTANDWDSGNVLMTGGTDGVVRMWSLEYVQVPEDAVTAQPQHALPGQPGVAHPRLSCTTAQDSNTTGSIIESIAAIREGRQMKLASRGDQKRASLTSAATSGKGGPESESKSVCSGDLGDDEIEDVPEDDYAEEDEEDEEVTKVKDNNSDDFVFKTGRFSNATLENHSGCDLSKSYEGSRYQASEDYNVTPNSVSDKQNFWRSMSLHSRPCNKLRPGFRWQRQLIFRSKLTMHTAYERQDNQSPAAVTALAISPDHRAVYVGDVRGRVFSWSVPTESSKSGGMSDHWVKDDNADSCAACGTRFSLTERRHHCRNCGRVFCSKCSRYESEIHRLRLYKPVRVCLSCYTSLRSASPAHSPHQTAPSKS